MDARVAQKGRWHAHNVYFATTELAERTRVVVAGKALLTAAAAG